MGQACTGRNFPRGGQSGVLWIRLGDSDGESDSARLSGNDVSGAFSDRGKYLLLFGSSSTDNNFHHLSLSGAFNVLNVSFSQKQTPADRFNACVASIG